jgi:Flp pilus assembly pilin Flp
MGPVARGIATMTPKRGANWERLEEGQGLAEYALILALIALFALVALSFLGEQISGVLQFIGESIESVIP